VTPGTRVRLRAALSRAGSALALRRCDRVGRGARLAGRPYVENLGRIVIGDGLRLGSRPVASHLVTGPRGALEIGDGVTVGYGAAIAAHAHVRIEDGVWIGPFAMIMDTDFHEVGDRSAAPVSRPICIGRDARIGARVTILRGATIGEGAEVAAGSVVAGEVPAGARVAGVPARAAGATPASDPTLTGTRTMPRVRRVVMRTFGLAAEPSDASGPDDIAAWDSLGTLNLLLSLEDAFCVTLRPEDLLAARRVGDLLAVVEGARRP